MLLCALEEPPPPEAIRAVGGVIYRHTKGGKVELLLIKKKLGYWTLVKGQLKTDELHAEAVGREIAEEVGLDGTVGALVQTVSYTVFKGGRPRTKIVSYYLFAAEKGELALSRKEQIVKARWFGTREALRRIRRRRVREVARLGAVLAAQEQ